MDDSLITQCPHCQTSFRLTQAQHQAAGGLVRCGVCLKVFDSMPAASEEQADRPLSAQALENDFDWQNDPPIDLDDIDLDQELARLQDEEERLQKAEPVDPLQHLLDPDNEPLASERIENDEIDADESIDQHLHALQPEPLQLMPVKPKSRWLANTVWTLLTLLALLGLAGQYVFYHYEELVRQEQYRPWLGKLCQVLNCTLPPTVDISQIKSSNLVVRSHPEFIGALSVDAILYNRANFAQPFPMLELRFSDRHGQLIASRRFKPIEYLGGEMAGAKEIPPQTPVHIALDILDPGPGAVNYRLDFKSPEETDAP